MGVVFLGSDDFRICRGHLERSGLPDLRVTGDATRRAVGDPRASGPATGRSRTKTPPASRTTADGGRDGRPDLEGGSGRCRCDRRRAPRGPVLGARAARDGGGARGQGLRAPCRVPRGDRRRRAGAEPAWSVATIPGFFEGVVDAWVGLAQPPAYRLKASNRTASWELTDPYSFGPVLGPLDDYLLIEGTHQRLYERLGASGDDPRGHRRRQFRGVGAQCRPRLGGRRLQRLGRPAPSDAQARRQRASGRSSPPVSASAPPTNTRSSAPRGSCCRSRADPFGFAGEMRADRPPRWWRASTASSGATRPG